MVVDTVNKQEFTYLLSHPEQLSSDQTSTIGDIVAEYPYFQPARALYLKGLKTILNYVDQGRSLDNLLIGKTSVEYIDTIDELVERKMINKPKYYTKIFKKHLENPEINPILQYIFNGIKD